LRGRLRAVSEPLPPALHGLGQHGRQHFVGDDRVELVQDSDGRVTGLKQVADLLGERE
jgi:hypothetical protein